jgi:hypothetical protein
MLCGSGGGDGGGRGTKTMASFLITIFELAWPGSAAPKWIGISTTSNSSRTLEVQIKFARTLGGPGIDVGLISKR